MLFRTLLLLLLATFSADSVEAGWRTSTITNRGLKLECSSDPNVGCSGLFSLHKNDGTEMALLTNGEISLQARLNALKNAKKSIRIQALIFTADEVGLYVADLLKQKKLEYGENGQGIDIKIIVDGLSNPGPKTQTMYFDLQQHGIEIEGYEAAYFQWVNELSVTDPEAPNKRFHEKMWIIDGEDEVNGTAVIGGMNIANEYFRLGYKAKMQWRDQDAIIRGPMVKDIVTAFDRNYAFFEEIKSSRGPLNSNPYWGCWNWTIRKIFKGPCLCLADEHGVPRIPFFRNRSRTAVVQKAADTPPDLKWESGKFRFVQNRPRLEENYVEQIHIQAFKTARKSIHITNAYFYPSDATLKAIRAAVRRGVHVILLVNSKTTNDVPAMAAGSRYHYIDLIRAMRKGKGTIDIYEWEGHKHGEGTLHAKSMVIDGIRGIVGSANMDARSESLNSESMVLFENESIAQAMEAQLLVDLQKSHKITMLDAQNYRNPGLRGKIGVMFSQCMKSQL